MKNSLVTKFLALLVCAIMVAGILPVAAIAEGTRGGVSADADAPTPPSSDADWKTIEGDGDPVSATYAFKLVDSLTSGNYYMILSSNEDTGTSNSAACLGVSTSSASLSAFSFGVLTDSEGTWCAKDGSLLSTFYTNCCWYYDGTKLSPYKYNSSLNSNYTGSNYYLYYNRGLTLSTSYDTFGYSSTYGPWIYNSYYIIYNSGFSATTSTSNASSYRTYIFERTVHHYDYGDSYVALSGRDYFVIQKGAYSAQSEVEEMIRENIYAWRALESDYSDADLTERYTFSGTINPAAEGEYTLNVLYEGVTIGTITVRVSDYGNASADTSIAVSSSGSAALGSASSVDVGATLDLTYSIDGATVTENIPITFGMVTRDGGFPTVGVYPDCTVTYFNGITYGPFTLEIYDPQNPDYPYPGSVSVDKSATGLDWFNTGLAKVELSAKGVPDNSGVDIIIIVDTSRSMNSECGDSTRIQVLRESLVELINTLNNVGQSGQASDVRVAIADFNNHSTQGSFAYNENDHWGYDLPLSGFEGYSTGVVYTGAHAINKEKYSSAEEMGYYTADAFVPVSSLVGRRFNEIKPPVIGSGCTNYDAGLGAAYMLGSAIRQQNKADGQEDRELVVIFMSDGCTHQFNFYTMSYDGSTDSSWDADTDNTDFAKAWGSWRAYVGGSTDENDTIWQNGNTLYTNGGNDFENYYAAAIKGSQKSLYSVVDKDGSLASAATGEENPTPIVGDSHMYNVPGLGAKLYTIGFGIGPEYDASTENYSDADIVMTADNVRYCLEHLSSGTGYFYEAQTANDLTDTFDDIAGRVLIAGKYAYYEDTMGDDYELQLADMTYGSGSTTYKQKIEVKRYITVKASDVGKEISINNVPTIITEEHIGMRTGEYTVLETVTFSSDGTQAYSDKIGAGINILVDGIINAKYFKYNTNNSKRTITVDALNPVTVQSDQPDLDHPYVMKSYSFSTSPLTDGSGWSREGSSSSTYRWQYDSTKEMMYSKGGSSASYADKFISPEFTVPAAGGRFQIQLSNEDYMSSGSGDYTTPINIYIRNSSGTDTLIMSIDHPFEASYRVFLNYFVDMVGTDANGQSYDFRNQTIKMVIERPAYSDYGATADDAVFYGYNFATVESGATIVRELAPYTFYWQIGDDGDITEDEIALSYNVYLKDSIIPGTGELGSCPDGIYPTNKGATLYYTNAKGNAKEKDTVSPVRPWGSAVANYAFYYVDENGKPIINLVTGQTGSFTNRITANGPIEYARFKFGTQKSISAADYADSFGYTLYDSDAKYSVTAPGSDSSAGSWTIVKGKENATTYVTGYDGSNASNALSNSSADTANTTVWFAVVYKVGAVSDAVVLDYGLPVNINVLDNDLLSMVAEKEIVGIGFASNMPAGQTSTLDKNFELDELPDGTSYKKGNFGTAKVADADRGIITYTLDNSKSMNFNAPETLAYAVQCLKGVNADGNKEFTYYYARLTIIPATTVYYEDNFITFYGNWGTDGKLVADAHQSQDRPGAGSNPLLDQNNPYGYDPAYDGCSQYSMGRSHCVTVNWDNMSSETAATASFTFSGTGFDIIGKTDSTSGTLVIEVYKANADGSNGDKVRSLIVDTYYGYKYEGGVWTPDPSNAAVWQVPVMKVEDLTYGQYNVKLLAMYHPYLDHNADGEYTLYIDAVRIYNPAMNNTTANNAYALDGEANPDYETVRNFVFNQMSSALEIEDFTGGVFIDGAGWVNYGVNDVGEFLYTNPSPNNEIYLAPGQAVYFKLRANVDPTNERVMIGVKLAFGSSASLTLTQLASDGRDISTDSIAAVTTATDMYYSLGNITWNPVKDADGKIMYYETNGLVLANPGIAGDVISNVISLTNLKISSYETEPKIKFADNITAASDVNELLAGDSALIVPCCDSDEAIAAAEYMNYNYGSYTLGDVNGDGEIDMLDTLITLRHTIGLAELWGAKRRAADMDGNGVIDAIDVMHIMRYVMENK
ncbi:MAG: dockerin type I domain-containing protein [Christensenellales bacterium]